MKFLYDQDADPQLLNGRRVAVIGYGNQGAAQALCLRDSGVPVLIGARPGRGRDMALAAGFEVLEPAAAAARADILLLLLPDEIMGEFFQRELAPALRPGATLCFAHGFCVVFGQIQPPPAADVVMVAPKGPGVALRQAYLTGSGLPALVAVHQDASGRARGTALALARALGCTRAGCLECSFRDETHGDLFGEQAVLCGGVSELAKAAFEVLTEAGCPPEIAYFECIHELKLVVDLLHTRGLQGMHEAISNTAEWGAYTAGPRVGGLELKERLRAILRQVQDGSFAAAWLAEARAGCPQLHACRAATGLHPAEIAGRQVRVGIGLKDAPVDVRRSRL